MKIIYIDMDGVLANFVQGVLALHRKSHVLEHDAVTEYHWYETEFGLTSDELLADTDAEFWQSLEKYSWAESVVGYAAETFPEAALFFCSTPCFAPGCYDGKLAWLEHHEFTGPRTTQFIPIHHKENLADPDSLLIDDKDENVEAFRERGGKAILFPQSWNKNAEFSKKRLMFLHDALQSVKAESEQEVIEVAP